MASVSLQVQLALDAICAYVTEGVIIEPPPDLPDELRKPSGAFVCLKKHGELRGCIGTIEPIHETLAKEIVHNGISAATGDPRFLPVEPKELPYLVCSVDVLSPPEPVDHMCQLHPTKYGVIVECGQRRGLLLPDLEGVNSAEKQVEIARGKARIYSDEPISLYRFEVARFH